VAIGLGRTACVAALLGAGADPQVKTTAKWSPLAEAVSAGQKDAVTSVAAAMHALGQHAALDKAAALLESLAALPDFYLEIGWDVHTWVPLVSRALPRDVLRIWKQGRGLRVDSSLLDLTEQTIHLGDRSYFFQLSGHAAQGHLLGTVLDHDDKTVAQQRLWPPAPESPEDTRALLAEEVNQLMGTAVADMFVEAEALAFVPATSGVFSRTARVEAIAPFKPGPVYNLVGLRVVTRTRYALLRVRVPCCVHELANHTHAATSTSRLKTFSSTRFSSVASSREPSTRMKNLCVICGGKFKQPTLRVLQPERSSLPPLPHWDTLSWDAYASASAATLPTLFGRPPRIRSNLRAIKATLWCCSDNCCVALESH
jgi:hypothetical protein